MKLLQILDEVKKGKKSGRWITIGGKKVFIEGKRRNKSAGELTVTKGTAEDTRGTEFNYKIYTVREKGTGKVLERDYSDSMGFGVKAKTLSELKNKIGKL